jgi:hypothetical protein
VTVSWKFTMEKLQNCHISLCIFSVVIGLGSETNFYCTIVNKWRLDSNHDIQFNKHTYKHHYIWEVKLKMVCFETLSISVVHGLIEYSVDKRTVDSFYEYKYPENFIKIVWSQKFLSFLHSKDTQTSLIPFLVFYTVNIFRTDFHQIPHSWSPSEIKLQNFILRTKSNGF